MKPEIKELLGDRIEIKPEEWELLYKEVQENPESYKEFSYLVGEPYHTNLAEIAIMLDIDNLKYFNFDYTFLVNKKTKRQFENIIKIAIENDIIHTRLVIYKLINAYNYRKQNNIKTITKYDKKKLYKNFAYLYALNKRTLDFIPDQFKHELSFNLYMIDIYKCNYSVPTRAMKDANFKDSIINKIYEDYTSGKIELVDIYESDYKEDFNDFLNEIEEIPVSNKYEYNKDTWNFDRS